LKFQQESETSFEDAIRQGIAEVNATIKHVEGAWVGEQKVLVQEEGENQSLRGHHEGDFRARKPTTNLSKRIAAKEGYSANCEPR